ARQLGCPEGTLAARLSRGRGMLARRLARRGLALPAGALAGLLAPPSASAGVPASVVTSTIAGATLAASGGAPGDVISADVLGLTEGVLTAMSNRTRVVAMALLLLAALGAGAIGLGRPVPTARVQADTPRRVVGEVAGVAFDAGPAPFPA